MSVIRRGKTTSWRCRANKNPISYIITNYEHSNFSVSQARFETNTPMDLVSIRSIDEAHEPGPSGSPSGSPSVTPKHSHRHRDIIIGASVGAAAFLLLIVVMSILVVRLRRRRTKVREESQSRHVYEKSVEPPTSAEIPTQEIGNNSMIWPFREVPDNGVVELPARTLPSDDDSQSSSAPRTPPPDPSVLQIGPSSQLNTSLDMGDPRRIHLSTTMSRSSRANNSPATSTSGIETFIFASPMSEHFDLEVASIATSNTKTAIFSSYMRKPLDLNRSLPPTPISESPQLSPAVASFNRGAPRGHPLRTPTNSHRMVSPFTSPKHPISSFFPRGRLPVGLLLDDAKFNDSTFTWGIRRSEHPANPREGWE